MSITYAQINKPSQGQHGYGRSHLPASAVPEARIDLSLWVNGIIVGVRRVVGKVGCWI